MSAFRPLPTPLRRLARASWPWLVLTAILILCAVNVGAWVDRNGLPDGFQNESIHVRNAMDLWQAWTERDGYTLGQVARTYYWPPGFYAWPIPLYGLMGASHAAMITANLGHLAVLLLACYLLGRALSDRAGGVLAAGLVVLYPSIFGNLVRFEPNVAVTAWVTLGTYCLLKSRGFADRRWSLLFGLACGVGLLMDRLSLAVFLALPGAVVALSALRRPERTRGLLNASLAVGALSAVAGWWLWSFYQVNFQELLDQGGVGEIDAAGTWTEQRDPTALATWLYYGTVLLDEQAGLIPGAAAIAGVVAALASRTRRRQRLVPALVVVAAVGLFTLVAKKQVYYTIPVLGCLAALTAAWLRSLGRRGWGLAAVVVLAGIHQAGWRVWERGLPLPGPVAVALGEQVLPASWTDRRHVQARPPRNLALPIDAMARAVGGGSVVVVSEDATWPEGFVVLHLRERLPGVWIRGMSNDPEGTYEQARFAETVVWVTPEVDAGWPSLDALEGILVNDNYALEHLPPVADTMASLEERFGVGGRWALPYGGSAVVFRAR